MSAHIATTGAIAFSGAALVLCLGGFFAIWQDMQQLWLELDQQMDQFRSQADGLWGDMLQMGAGTPANRERRQALTVAQQSRLRRNNGGSSYGGYAASQQQANCSQLNGT